MIGNPFKDIIDLCDRMAHGKVTVPKHDHNPTAPPVRLIPIEVRVGRKSSIRIIGACLVGLVNGTSKFTIARKLK